MTMKAIALSAAFGAVLLALETGSLHAQQPNPMHRQRLTRIEVPGTDFDLIIDSANSVAATTDGATQRDPLEVGLWATHVFIVPKSQ